MPVAERDGAAIYYADAGDGPPVLFVHGGLHQPMNGARFWVGPGPAIDLVAADRRVLVPDRRWMGGGTSASLAVHTWQLEADDMAAAITDAQAGPVDVVAGSNGCSLGLRLTLDHPDLVRTLVLCWPAAPHRREGAAAFINLAKRVEADGPRVLGTADAADAAGRTAGVAPWEAAAGDERFHESLAEFDNVTAAAVVRESAAALFAGDLIRGVDESESATIADSGRAVWVIPSEHFDHWHDEATFDAVMRAIPGCRRGPAMPESPTSRFASARDRFAEFVGSVLSRD